MTNLMMLPNNLNNIGTMKHRLFWLLRQQNLKSPKMWLAVECKVLAEHRALLISITPLAQPGLLFLLVEGRRVKLLNQCLVTAIRIELVLFDLLLQIAKVR